MSKAALDQMTNCIALELADKGIRVNSVNPVGLYSNSLTQKSIRGVFLT